MVLALTSVSVTEKYFITFHRSKAAAIPKKEREGRLTDTKKDYII